jgi:phage gpG-like protein
MADKNYEVKFKPNFENGVLIGMYKGLTAWASLVAQRASEKAPVDTGRLARSIHAGTPFPLSEFVMAVDVGTNVEYARAHEFGSGIHRTIGTPDYIIIRPKNAKALAFPKTIRLLTPNQACSSLAW